MLEVRMKQGYGFLNRRAFLKAMGITGAGLLLDGNPALAIPSCMDIGGTEQETVAAFMDTLIPREESPYAPGLVEMCGLRFVYDPFYPVANLVPAIVLALDAASLFSFGRRFGNLENLSDRETVVGATLGAIPLDTAVAILKAPFSRTCTAPWDGKRSAFAGPVWVARMHPETNERYARVRSDPHRTPPGRDYNRARLP